MDVDELAAYLKLQKQTIYNWLHAKKISGIKVGHVWRFDKRTIDAWLRSQIREAQTPEDKKSPKSKG
jgi:excisionase family DNA binding protein